MPRSNGVYSLPPVYLAQPGTPVRSEQHNVPLEDIAQSLTNSLPRDGSAPMLSNIPMGGRKVTGLGAATDPADAVRFDQLPTSPFLLALAGLVAEADRLPYATGASTAAMTVLTAFARSLLDDADAAAMRTTLDLKAGALAEGQDQSIWNAGASTVEALISAAKLQAKIAGMTVGGTPQQLSGSRAFATTYENTSGRPIFVTVTVLGNGSTGSAEVMLGASAGAVAAHASVSASNGFTVPISFYVPAGWFYRLNNVSGAPFISYWSEVRT